VPTSLAPRIGQHSREILKEFTLGDAEIDQMLHEGIVHQDNLVYQQHKETNP